MTTKTKVKIIGWLIELIVFLFAFGGWILFIFSLIRNEKLETELINRQTEEIRKEIRLE